MTTRSVHRPAWLLVGVPSLLLGLWSLHHPRAPAALPAGNIAVPTARTLDWQERSAQTDEVLVYWAGHRQGDYDFTLTELLNLDAFGSDRVQRAARDLLDQLNWRYVLGSLRFRRFPPFRRQYAHAADTALDGDRQVALIKVWASRMPGV